MTRHIIGPERDGMAVDAAARYDAGDSIRNIAHTINRSFGFTRDLLLSAGVQLRDKNWRAKAGAR
jgi:hypothetical protein